MPVPYPKEFRDDVIAVARRRDPDVTLKQIEELLFGLSLDPPTWWGDGRRVSAESALPVATMAVLNAVQLRNERAPSE